MAISVCKKIFIVLGSFVGLAVGLAVIGYRAVSFTAGVKQHCGQDAKKCNETNPLYHLDTQQCLKKGQYPGDLCGNNMVISPLITCKNEVVCECDYENIERHLVYDDGTDQCYPIYSQGPCENGYVVTISLNGTKLKCRPDNCVDIKSKVSSTERDSIVPYLHKCYALSTELDEPECKGQLKFWKNQLHPSCDPPPIQARLFTAYIPLKCQFGSRRAFFGDCKFSRNLKFQNPSYSSEESEEDVLIRTANKIDNHGDPNFAF